MQKWVQTTFTFTWLCSQPQKTVSSGTPMLSRVIPGGSARPKRGSHPNHFTSLWPRYQYIGMSVYQYMWVPAPSHIQQVHHLETKQCKIYPEKDKVLYLKIKDQIDHGNCHSTGEGDELRKSCLEPANSMRFSSVYSQNIKCEGIPFLFGAGD